MNKLKKIIILLLVCNISLIHSMYMPLAFVQETEKEFIERTKNLPRSQQNRNPLFDYFIEPIGSYNGFAVICPSNITCAILRPAQHTTLQSQLAVITSEGYVYARQFLGYKKIIAIALAANRELFAAIYQECDPMYASDTIDVLKIKKLDTKKIIKTITLPKTFEAASAYYSSPVIAFNKQGTHVIVWGVDSTQRGSYKSNPYGTPALDHMIFDLDNSK